MKQKLFLFLLIFLFFNKNINIESFKKNQFLKKINQKINENKEIIITIGSIFGIMIIAGFSGILVRNKKNNGSYFNFKNWFCNKK